MDETLFNYNIKLPFDVVGTDLASGQRGVEIFKKFKKNKNKPTKLQEAKDFYGENLRDIESKISEPKTALEKTEEYLNSLKKAQEELLPVQRRAARAGAIDQFANYALTEPIRQMFLNRAAELGDQRYLNTRAIVEGMPSNVQKIMKSKQEQQALASAAFATEAQAIANQTDAATRMGGLGMQRRFG